MTARKRAAPPRRKTTLERIQEWPATCSCPSCIQEETEPTKKSKKHTAPLFRELAWEEAETAEFEHHGALHRLELRKKYEGDFFAWQWRFMLGERDVDTMQEGVEKTKAQARRAAWKAARGWTDLGDAYDD